MRELPVESDAAADALDPVNSLAESSERFE